MNPRVPTRRRRVEFPYISPSAAFPSVGKLNQGSMAGPWGRGLIQDDSLELETRVEQESARAVDGVEADRSANRELGGLSSSTSRETRPTRIPSWSRMKEARSNPSCTLAPVSRERRVPSNTLDPYRSQEDPCASHGQIDDRKSVRRSWGNREWVPKRLSLQALPLVQGERGPVSPDLMPGSARPSVVCRHTDH